MARATAKGLSTFIHTDEMGAIAGAASTVGMPDAGAFRVVTPGCCSWENTVELHNSTGALNAKCTAAQAAGEAWKCFTVPTLHSYLQSPLFVLQSQFDHFQLSVGLYDINSFKRCTCKTNGGCVRLIATSVSIHCFLSLIYAIT